MIDKGERGGFRGRRGGREGRKSRAGIVMTVLQVAVIAILVFSVVQQNQTGTMLQRLLGEAEGVVHDIYDDTAVVEAYHSGDASKLNEKDQFVLETASGIIDDIIEADMTPYEKEKAVYDWQWAWVHYSDEDLNPITGSSDNYTPYGVLTGHDAICVGNATTFRLFMDMLDVPCMIIHSTEQGEHAWDLVQLDDEWYHVDVTFDNGNYAPSYSYFNVPDSVKDDGSWPWDHEEIPAATGTKYCYMLTNAVECEDMYDIPMVLKEGVEKNETMITVTLKNREGFSRSVADYVANNFGSVLNPNGYMYFSDALSLGGKTVYLFINNVVSEDAKDQQDIYDRFQEILAKMQEEMQAGKGDSNGGDDPVGGPAVDPLPTDAPTASGSVHVTPLGPDASVTGADVTVEDLDPDAVIEKPMG